MKVISLWSGGKDSCLACYKAKNEGHRIAGLLNFSGEDGRSLSHGIKAELIRRQAQNIDIPFVQEMISRGTYTERFKALISERMEKEKLEGIVFGDIYLKEHKDWIDKICRELKIKPILPLWGRDTKELIGEFLDAGFKTIIVTTEPRFLDERWLGRVIDRTFVEELAKDIDPCGEKGEFHTFVYDGPLFKEAVKFRKENKRFEEKRWFLELT